MAVKTKQEIINDATTFIPDNTNYEVSPADIRQRIIDVVDSTLFDGDLPDLATVATTGSYNDLTNKPTYATVANTGSYNDLTNKPALANVAITGQYVDLINKPVLSTVATSGAYSDLTGKPTLGSAAAANTTDFLPANTTSINLVSDAETLAVNFKTSTANVAQLFTMAGLDAVILRSFYANGSSASFTFNTNGTLVLPTAPVTTSHATNKGYVDSKINNTAVVFDSSQSLTATQQSQARGNISADLLTPGRNKIINGNFDFWQRATTQNTAGYGSDDRWINYHLGTTGSFTHSRGVFTAGTSGVPNSPRYYSSTSVTHAVAAGNGHVKEQRIENLAQFSGRWITVTFYAKADSNKNIAIELSQNYGTGGSPSATVSMPCGLVALTTSWQKYSVYVQIPSMAGKTFGTNGEHNLGVLFWFDAGSNFSTRASNLGQQSGVFDLAHVSVVFDDARNETDPFSERPYVIEQLMCQRYYRVIRMTWSGYIQASGWRYFSRDPLIPYMRAIPTIAAATASQSGFSTTIGTQAADPATIIVGLDSTGSNMLGEFTVDVKLDAEL